MTKACAGARWSRTPTSRLSNRERRGGPATRSRPAAGRKHVGGRMTLVLKGVMQSPVTPLKNDFSPDYETFERLVDFHVRTGATAISWPHHKAESHNLTIAERKALGEVAINATAGRIPITIHVSALSLEDTFDLARHAQQAGADA